MRRLHLLALVLLPLTAVAHPLGNVSFSPSEAVSTAFGTWTLTYTAGESGMVEGGAIRVQLPDEMHSGPRNSANRLQATEPSAPHYVSASTSAEGVVLECTVEHQSEKELAKDPRPSLDGRFERYVYVVRVQVKQGTLQAGEKIVVVYGDTSQGSPGYRAGEVVSSAQPILMAVDAAGTGEFHLHDYHPVLELLPGAATELQIHLPSRTTVGQHGRLLVSILDAAANPAVGPKSKEQRVHLKVIAGEAEIPATVTVPQGASYADIQFLPKAAGIIRLEGTVEGAEISAMSNPSEATEQPTQDRILWGDLHSHTSYSWDGVGQDAFNYARNMSGLDFLARTDHSNEPTENGPRGLYEGTWEKYCAETEAHHAPPQFVTLHAYECSYGTPYGHHNVYFRGAPGPLLYPSKTTLPQLWEALKAGEALTIPHHTGKMPRPVDLTVHNPEFRRNFEIYSGHGLSEAYNPQHPLAFEQSDFTEPSKSQQTSSNFQDALRLGQHLSTVAASDDHRAKPGQPHYGITALYAPENSREGVFDALYNRRTYGTTGAKIILDFTLDGKAMGSIATVAEAPEARIHVVGTDVIAWIELLRLQPGQETFEVLHRWTPNALAADEVFQVPSHVAGAVYYVRLQQANMIRGRVVMAWSSPVWTAG